MELVQVKMPDGTWKRVPSIVGPKGDPYTLTDADKAEIARQASELIPVQKIQIDYLGNKVFKMGDRYLNFADIYNYHITAPNFTFIVYGDRAYLCSFINVDDTTKEMRFESVINSDNRTKVSSIYITSNDGVNITSVSTTNINNENSSNKVNEITEANEDSTDKYPSLAAIKPIREGVNNKVGYSEVVDGKLLMYSDNTKAHLLATLDLPGGVTDVQLEGNSVLADGVAKIPYATDSRFGIVKTNTIQGITYNSTLKTLSLSAATNAHIHDRNRVTGITPTNIDYAVKAAMTDGKGAAWTAEEQLAGRQRLGLDKEWTLVGTLNTDNKDTGVTVDLSGCTELAISGYVYASGAMSLTCNLHHLIDTATQANNYRVWFAIFADGLNGIEPIICKFRSSTAAPPSSFGLYGNGNGYYFGEGEKISEITAVYFTSPSAISDCSIKIYAR